MRRKDKEITDPAAIEAIIRSARICRLAMCDGDRPYLVPLSYGYEDNTLYFHSATQGRKIDILQRNPEVCFEIEGESTVVPGESPCKWTITYRSVIGFGRVRWITEDSEKRRALDRIMARHGAEGAREYDPPALKRTTVMAVEIQSMTGKQSG